MRKIRPAKSAAALSARRSHRFAPMVVLLAGLAVTGGVYAGLTSTSSAQATSTDASAQEIAHGRALFLEGCATCHGLSAQGSVNATTLIGVGAAAVDFQVGTGRMPLARPGTEAESKPPSYTQSEIDALSAYVASLAPGPAIPADSQLDYSGANLQQGGELFRTNCAQCHNFAGEGGALVFGAFAPTLGNATPKQMYEAMLTGPEEMPVFADGTLSPDEKLAIIKFVSTMRAQPNPGGLALGRLGPVTEGLFLWTVGLGAVIGVAIWIGVRVS
jgi:ubiquinol-cytochrome c reductase cytochrome c subunit